MESFLRQNVSQALVPATATVSQASASLVIGTLQSASATQVFTQNATATSLNCSEPRDWRPNSDIAGIGVILSFWISAWATLCLSALYAIVHPSQSSNALDESIINFISSVYVKITPKAWNTHGQTRPQQWWAEVIETAVLTFSDTQILTGIAILVSGYVQLPAGLDLYHWSILVDLAWFSSLTHLTTLTALREYFRKRVTLAVVRTIFMGLNLILLVVAMVPVAYSTPVFVSPAPAICLFKFNIPWDRLIMLSSPTEQSSAGFSATISFDGALIAITWTFLLVSYLTRIIRLYAKPAALAQKCLRSWPGLVGTRLYQAVRKRKDDTSSAILSGLLTVTLLMLRALYVFAKAIYILTESMSYEIFWLTAALVWGTLRLVGSWTKARSLDTAEETNWGFGQVLPMVLLAAPAFSMGEFIYETRFKQSSHTSQPSRPPAPILTAAAATFSNEDAFQVDLHEKAWFSGVICLVFIFVISFASVFLLLFAAFPFSNKTIDGVLQTNFPYSIGTNDLTANFPNDLKSFLRFSATSLGITYFYIVICLILQQSQHLNIIGLATSRLATVVKNRTTKAVALVIFLFVCAAAIAASSYGIAYHGVLEPLNVPIGTLVANTVLATSTSAP